MTCQQFYEHIAEHTGEDVDTIASFGFELEMPRYADSRRLRRRQRRWRPWLQERHASSSNVVIDENISCGF